MVGITQNQKIVADLVEVLHNDDSEVRLASLRALREVKSKSLVKSLIPMLTDSDASIRLETINVLGEIGDKRALRPLINCLNDSVSENREASALALGMMPDPISIGPLAKISRDTYSWVRVAAAFSLGKIHSRKCVEPLIQCLNDVNHVVQVTAAKSLRGIKSEKVVLSLIEKLRVDDGSQGENGEETNSELLRRLEILINHVDEPVDKPSWNVCVIPDKVVFDSLMENTESGNPLLRRVCAISLGAMKSKRAVTQLIVALDDPIQEVREAAAWAIGSIKDK
jgi:HEAT repeat protein